MEQSYTISKRGRYYTLYNTQDQLLLYTSNKNLCYRYMYELQGLPVPDQYQKRAVFQDISVDKPSK